MKPVKLQETPFVAVIVVNNKPLIASAIRNPKGKTGTLLKSVWDMQDKRINITQHQRVTVQRQLAKVTRLNMNGGLAYTNSFRYWIPA